MGGILTRMQVTNPGRALWNAVFRDKADKFYAELPTDSIIKRALIFRANPHVARVVFFSVPHRGSDLANLRISALSRRASSACRSHSSRPSQADHGHHASGRSFAPRHSHEHPGLSPRSRLLVALAKLPISVPCDNHRRQSGQAGPLAESSDGVVPYWSSHVDFAKSELVVPTGHNSFDNPASVADLERILGVK